MLGASVTVHPIQVEAISIYDAWILIGASLLVMIPALIKKEIRRGWGLLFILAYFVYSYYIIVR